MSKLLRKARWSLGVVVIASRLSGSWGVDASLSTHVKAGGISRYVELLGAGRLVWIGERGAEVYDYRTNTFASQREKFDQITSAGYSVVAYAQLAKLKPINAANALPEDLLEVFRAGANLGCEFFGSVDAWQMVTESDIGYCRDLPDRLTAFQKAMYLGLKLGSKEAIRRDVNASGGMSSKGRISMARKNPQSAPVVLMGALSMPPGPWLKRAVANGLLEYTDAYNFHHYGWADDLPGAIEAHAALAWRRSTGVNMALRHKSLGLWEQRERDEPLPLWITECGINAVPGSDFLNPERRRLQAEFTVATAAHALADRRVAVFMPFILVHEGDPHAMTLSASEPLPAWTAYRQFMREHPWPKRPVARPPAEPNPVVLQWMPNNATTRPHKVSGTYRFIERQPILGAVRVYNFSDHPRRGRVVAGPLRGIGLQAFWPSVVEVPPFGRIDLPVQLEPPAEGYWFEEWTIQWDAEVGLGSTLQFSLETEPGQSGYATLPLALVRPTGDMPKHLQGRFDTVTSHSGPWLGLNGLQVSVGADPTSLHVNLAGPQDDPLRGKLVVARVAGLPREGFLHLALDRPIGPDFYVAVHLVDKRGQRFTIWENCGFSYYTGDGREAWLNLADFHPYIWSRYTSDLRFRPEVIEEIQLRCYPRLSGDPRQITLSLRVPERAEVKYQGVKVGR